MDGIEIKDIEGNYKKISELLEKLRYALVEHEIEDELGLYYHEGNVKYIYDALKYKLGAFKNGKLVGIIGSSSVNGIYNKTDADTEKIIKTEIKIASLGRFGIDPEVWDDPSIKNDLIDTMIDKLKKEGHDLIYAALLKKKDKEDIEALKLKGFRNIKGRKNSETLVKVMGKDGLELIKKTRGMNPIEAQAARLIAGIKSDEIERGEIRDGNENDYDQIIDLLNKYSKELPLARIWQKKEFSEMMERTLKIDNWDFSDLKKSYPDAPLGSHFKVWEVNNEIIGVVLFYISTTRMVKEPVPMGSWLFCAFSDNVEPNETKAFISTLLREIKGSVSVMNIELPYYANKIFGKSGFMGDQRAVALLIKPLTDKVKGIFEEKIKNYYLDICGYNI